MALAYLVAGVGCYQPELASCTVSCSAPTDCAAGQQCKEGWCMLASESGCNGNPGVPLDSGITATHDGSMAPTDAPLDLCAAGCTNGTCVGGVCVIDCTADGSCNEHDIHCPANIPCRVECGSLSCGKKIFCDLASSCDVRCTGDYACKDDINCNGNECNVTCSGPNSCDHKVKCSNSCACDVTCSGLGSCGEINECPSSTCRLGEGCSSALAGCNTCT